MSDFTVIGVYEDGSTFEYNVSNVKDAHEAMRVAASEDPEPGELQIIGAIEGLYALVSACEDSFKAAFAIDLIATEDDQ